MGVRDYIRIVADGGDRTTHFECRACGKNLDADQQECPACGGEVAVYKL